MTDTNAAKVDTSEVKIVTHEGEPAIELPGGRLIVLHTFVNEWTHQHPNNGESVDMDVEVDSDEHAWWNLHPNRCGNLAFGTEAFPKMVIEPRIARKANREASDGDLR